MRKRQNTVSRIYSFFLFFSSYDHWHFRHFVHFMRILFIPCGFGQTRKKGGVLSACRPMKQATQWHESTWRETTGAFGGSSQRPNQYIDALLRSFLRTLCSFSPLSLVFHCGRCSIPFVEAVSRDLPRLFFFFRPPSSGCCVRAPLFAVGSATSRLFRIRVVPSICGARGDATLQRIRCVANTRIGQTPAVLARHLLTGPLWARTRGNERKKTKQAAAKRPTRIHCCIEENENRDARGHAAMCRR